MTDEQKPKSRSRRRGHEADAELEIEYHRIPERELLKSNHELGLAALDMWHNHCSHLTNGKVAYPPDAETREALNRRLDDLSGTVWDNYDTYVVLAWKYAALGELTKAGEIFRAFILVHNGKQDLGFRHDGDPAEKKLRSQWEARRRAGKKSSQEAALRREKWLEIGRPLRERHPYKSNVWLAIEIATRIGDRRKQHSIRKELDELGLGKRKKPRVSSRS